MAFERSGHLAEIRHAASALHLPNAAVTEGDFAGESGISAGFARQIFQIFEGPPDEELAGGGGAGKIDDRVMELVHDGVGEFLDVVKTALGAAGFEPRKSRER